jgi:GTPase SAR1 family protein
MAGSGEVQQVSGVAPLHTCSLHISHKPARFSRAEFEQVNRKIALLGDRGVGKTSLAAFFVEGRFSERYDPTIEVTYQKKVNFKRMTFLTDIVDTAGMVSGRCDSTSPLDAA